MSLLSRRGLVTTAAVLPALAVPTVAAATDTFMEMEGKIYELARWCDLAHTCLVENHVKIDDDGDGTQMLLERISEKSKELLIMYERAFQERCASKH